MMAVGRVRRKGKRATMGRAKADTITFKVEAPLMELLRRVPNRSAFIRGAILNALENACPLCQGSGHLSPDQKRHWDAFAADHGLQECGDCHELHLVCRGKGGKSPRGRRTR